jgi:hypothetical protein
MLIDYLRYVAFEGRLRGFFEESLLDYVKPSVTTGQHLRFNPEYLQNRFGIGKRDIFHNLYWNSHSEGLIFDELKERMGLEGGSDNLIAPQYKIGERPSTFRYKELNRFPELQIIIDIDPIHWTEYSNSERQFNGVPVIYRRAGPAKANLRSGDRLFKRNEGRSGYGTLCGVFTDHKNLAFALTCGHVADIGAHMLVEQRHKIWKLPAWSSFTTLGNTRYLASNLTIPNNVQTYSNVQTHLDAALIEMDFHKLNFEQQYQASLKPISTLLQEEPVRFRGAGRYLDSLARVSAITVRKSIDLFKNGQLHQVGDVLMLGHRHPMYFVQRVSRPGDSGAAVRQDFSSFGQFTQLNQWHGMILGSDEGGAYASYAEHLWAWATQVTGDTDIDFFF